MRILVFIHEYPPVGGGGGKVAQDICRGLAARGHEIQILTSHWGNLPLEEDQDRILIQRLKSGRRLPYKAGLAAMLFFVLASFWAGWRTIRRWKPDVLHVHFAVPAGAVALALSRLCGVPYVLTAHLGDVPGGVPEKTAGWFRWIYPFTPPIWKSAGQVVAVSNFTRSIALQHYPVNIQVIPNGVNLDELNPGEIEVNDPPHIVFAGRFVPQKNPLQVVRSLATLKDLPWKCTMLGEGPLTGQVVAEVSRLQLEERIILPGWVTPEEVNACFKRSDILFMPSLSEGMPVVGLNALAMGLAILASRIGGWADLVTAGENGLLLDSSSSAEEWGEALRSLVSNPSRLEAFRLASRHKAADFDLNKLVDSYEMLFKQVATRNK